MPDGMHIFFFGSLIALVISIEELVRGAVSSAHRRRQEQEGAPKQGWFKSANIVWLVFPVAMIMGIIISGTEIHFFPDNAIKDVVYFLFAFLALILFLCYGILRILEKRQHRKEDTRKM